MQTFNRFLDGRSELDDISEGVGPGLANSGLVFLHRFLNPVGLSNSCVLAKTCDAANKAGPNQVDKRLGSFGSQVVEHKEGVLIDGIAFVPVQGSQVKQISIQSGLSPTSEDAAACPCVLRNHVEYGQSLHRNS